MSDDSADEDASRLPELLGVFVVFLSGGFLWVSVIRGAGEVLEREGRLRQRGRTGGSREGGQDEAE